MVDTLEIPLDTIPTEETVLQVQVPYGTVLIVQYIFISNVFVLRYPITISWSKQ